VKTPPKTRPANTNAHKPPEARQPAPAPAPAPERTCELLDGSKHGPVPLRLVHHLQVFRVVQDGSRMGRRTWLYDAPADATRADVTEASGGGAYYIQARDADNTPLTGCSLDLPGAPTDATTARAQPSGPVQSIPHGMIAIPGLSPEQQQQFYWMQAMQERERMRIDGERASERDQHKLHMETLATLMGGAMGGRGGEASDELRAVVRSLRTELEARNEENRKLREELAAVNKRLLSSTVELNNAENEKADDPAVKVILGALQNPEGAEKLLDALFSRFASARAQLPNAGAATNGAASS
jgi:hypothetical protein